MSQSNCSAAPDECRYAAHMTDIFSLYTLDLLLLIAATAVIAGMVKGIVGFAMPMIFITGMTIFVAPDLALGILILPTLVTNGWQAGRQGFSAALKSLYDHRWFLGLGYGVLLATTQLVPLLSQDVFFLCLGILVVGFASLMLSGWKPQGRSGASLSFACAVIAGIGGGISGVWGPPTVMYLSTHQLEKQAQMRAQGVIYGLGAVLLLFGHLGSGIATPQALSLGGFAIVPACFGIWIGFQIQDRINQNMFRIATLSVLILAGLNLIRRGVM
jgi:uncharacterized membrane protein YfcA